MNSISTDKILPYTPHEMYTLVNDIEKYPEFLPWCSESVIHEQYEEELRATLVLSASGFTKAITTLNRMQKDKMIEMRLVDGPLKHFESFWRFESVPSTDGTTEQCHVFFNIEFEFTNRLIRMALEPFFNKVADTMVDAFSKRAEALYKKS